MSNNLNETTTPQTKPIPGKESLMAENNAGGFSFTVTPKTQLLRFLILGSESGSYYATEQKLTAENAKNVIKMIQSGDGLEVVKTVVEVSDSGRAAKQDTGILVLALCIRLGDDATRKAAYASIGKVCRIPTTLFQLLTFTSTLEGKAPAGVEVKEQVKKEGDDMETVDLGVNKTTSKRKMKKSPAYCGRGWGRGMRKAIGNWYNEKEVGDLVFTVTKYKNREGWNHADVLRVAHVAPKTRGHDLVFRYLTYGLESAKAANVARDQAKDVEMGVADVKVTTADEEWVDVKEEMGSKGVVKSVEEVANVAPAAEATADVMETDKPKKKEVTKRERVPKTYTTALPVESVEAETKAMELLEIVETASRTNDEAWAIEAIRSHHLAREHLSTGLLNSVQIWDALLSSMPLTAMIRNLGKMTSIGLLAPLSDATFKVTQSLRDTGKLHRARIHPFNVLVALNQYKQGRGLKGSLSWGPVPEITAALNDAFYASFSAVIPTNKRYLVGLDVSGSMCSPVLGSQIDCRTASAAMAMVLARTEPRTHFMAFCGDFVPLNFTASDRLET
ncbi:60 kDa SS-A/Ro ribonucleoprotein, partial [Blyttiomyces sp. JEL0837]